ncbi:hypothetical protein LEMLEM_LOCUS14149, partial [Lemmus lemmus]
MPLKMTTLCKGFTTLITLIRFLSSMCSFMYLKRTALCKGFTTLITFIGLFSSMCS